MEISKVEARRIMEDEIKKYQGCPIKEAKYNLYGMLDMLFKLALISALQLTQYTNKIKAVKPWEKD